LWDPSDLSWPLSSGGEGFLLEPSDSSWLLSSGGEGFLLDPSDSPPSSPLCSGGDGFSLDPSDSPPSSPLCSGGDGFSLDPSDFDGPLPSLPSDSDGWTFSNERVWDFGNSSGRRVRGFGKEIE